MKRRVKYNDKLNTAEYLFNQKEDNFIEITISTFTSGQDYVLDISSNKIHECRSPFSQYTVDERFEECLDEEE